MLDGSEENGLMLGRARLGEVHTRAGATRAASLALEAALATLATKLFKVLGLDLLPQRLVRLLVGGDRGEGGQEVWVHVWVGEEART